MNYYRLALMILWYSLGFWLIVVKKDLTAGLVCFVLGELQEREV